MLYIRQRYCFEPHLAYGQLVEQFSYSMVGEMQDTDRQRWRLIKLLADLLDTGRRLEFYPQRRVVILPGAHE